MYIKTNKYEEIPKNITYENNVKHFIDVIQYGRVRERDREKQIESFFVS